MSMTKIRLYKHGFYCNFYRKCDLLMTPAFARVGSRRHEQLFRHRCIAQYSLKLRAPNVQDKVGEFYGALSNNVGTESVAQYQTAMRAC